MSRKTDAVSAPHVPIKVFGADGKELTVTIEDLFFAQYASMALFRKLGFDPNDIYFAQGVYQRDLRTVPFYGVALRTQGKQCIATSYPHDCIRMEVGAGHAVYCSPAIVAQRWPEYAAEANKKADPSFEAKLRQHQIQNILNMIGALQKKGIDIPVFAPPTTTVLQ